MKFFKSTLTLLAVFCAPTAYSQEAKEITPEQEAMMNMQMGMAGLNQAANDPVLLAQLMKDLQNPEMMAEAKKMMDSPEFKKQMKKLSETPEFKDNMKKSVDMMKDPSYAAKMEAKMEHMQKVGDSKLQEGASLAMEEAMNAMGNPEVMKDMAKMMSDPQFKSQLAKMAQDPSFQTYVNAMQDMMKDPEKKAKIEKASAAFKSQL